MARFFKFLIGGFIGWPLLHNVLHIFIWIQFVELRHFYNRIDAHACISAIHRVGKKPVLPACHDRADRVLAHLSSYEDKLHYTQDIFILIFSENALRYSSLVVKDEDNIII